jgi:imidazolonepropionase-like amidohydrolase
LNEVTFKAAVDAAKRRGKLAVIHVKTTEHARWAAEAGASGLTHAYYLGPVVEELPKLLRERRMFVIPTLTVYEAVWGLERRSELLRDHRINRFLTSEGVDQLKRQLPETPTQPVAKEQYESAATNVLRLFRAGVPILAGSDAPNPGTVHGASLHRELELLVEAGLPPLEVLRSATSLPARHFQLDGRGVIEQGGPADLVLVNGYPDREIKAARDIVAIWKEGRRFDRAVATQVR